MRMRLCLEDVLLHLISPSRWKMHKVSRSFCCSEHQRPKGSQNGGKWWVGKLKEKIEKIGTFFLLCFGNNHRGCLDFVESLLN